MKIHTTLFLKAKWNSLMGILVAFAVLFSTSALAGTIEPQMQKSLSLVSVTCQASSDEVIAIGDHQNCCHDAEKLPCNEDNGCKISCMNFSMSYAVLSLSGRLMFMHSQTSTTPDYTVRAGISASLNAPPPRA